jgi:hypothetical protein
VLLVKGHSVNDVELCNVMRVFIGKLYLCVRMFFEIAQAPDSIVTGRSVAQVILFA